MGSLSRGGRQRNKCVAAGFLAKVYKKELETKESTMIRKPSAKESRKSRKKICGKEKKKDQGDETGQLERGYAAEKRRPSPSA